MIRNLIILISFLANSSFAESIYTPYRFLSDELKTRPDLQTRYEVLIPDDSDIKLEALNANDVELMFHQEVAELLKQARSQKVYRNQMGQTSVKMCHTHQKAAKDGTFEINNICPSLKNIFRQIKPKLDSICFEVENPFSFIKPPHSYMRTLKAESYEKEKLDSILGMIEVAFSPLMTTNTYPKELLSQKLVSTFSNVILKLRKKELEFNIQSQLKLYEKILWILSQNPECVPNPQETANIVERLADELHGALSVLKRMDENGRLEAENDNDGVFRNNLCRSPLPYPSITDAERQSVSMYLGSFYWRFRGGGVWRAKGTSELRSHFVKKTFTTLAKFNGAPMPKWIAGGIKIKLQLKGWGAWFDMGRGPGADKYQDLVQMTKRGIYQVGIGSYNILDKILYPGSPVKALKKFKYDTRYLEVSGQSIGACYFYGWEYLSGQHITSDWLTPKLQLGMGATTWGELCAGASLGLGLSKTLLHGHECR